MSFATDSKRGVLVHYGPRVIDESFGGASDTRGRTKSVVYKFSYDDLPVASTDGLTFTIPAGAMILDAYFVPTTAFAGGTSYDIGLEQPDGTDIDVDGLFDALVLADIDASVAGSLTASEHAGTNSGVLCGQTLAADAQLIVVATGTFTAGEAKFVIEYME